MRALMLALTGALILGCATQDRRPVTDAVDDYVKVAELEELDVVRTTSTDQFNYDELSDEYIILKTRRDYYLAKFVRRCSELRDTRPTPDIRREPNTLRARFDTIRGCRIENIYAIDKAQAEELKQLGYAPGARN